MLMRMRLYSAQRKAAKAGMHRTSESIGHIRAALRALNGRRSEPLVENNIAERAEAARRTCRKESEEMENPMSSMETTGRWKEFPVAVVSKDKTEFVQCSIRKFIITNFYKAGTAVMGLLSVTAIPAAWELAQAGREALAWKTAAAGIFVACCVFLIRKVGNAGGEMHTIGKMRRLMAEAQKSVAKSLDKYI